VLSVFKTAYLSASTQAKEDEDATTTCCGPGVHSRGTGQSPAVLKTIEIRDREISKLFICVVAVILI